MKVKNLQIDISEKGGRLCKINLANLTTPQKFAVKVLDQERYNKQYADEARVPVVKYETRLQGRQK